MSFVDAVLAVCRCGHPALRHDEQGLGCCRDCVCGPFELDRHVYPLGMVVTSG